MPSYIENKLTNKKKQVWCKSNFTCSKNGCQRF